MVQARGRQATDLCRLSVLALSSRFDGRYGSSSTGGIVGPFSTRSVESF